MKAPDTSARQRQVEADLKDARKSLQRAQARVNDLEDEWLGLLDASVGVEEDQ